MNPKYKIGDRVTIYARDRVPKPIINIRYHEGYGYFYQIDINDDYHHEMSIIYNPMHNHGPPKYKIGDRVVVKLEHRNCVGCNDKSCPFHLEVPTPITDIKIIENSYVKYYYQVNDGFYSEDVLSPK